MIKGCVNHTKSSMACIFGMQSRTIAISRGGYVTRLWQPLTFVAGFFPLIFIWLLEPSFWSHKWSDIVWPVWNRRRPRVSHAVVKARLLRDCRTSQHWNPSSKDMARLNLMWGYPREHHFSGTTLRFLAWSWKWTLVRWSEGMRLAHLLKNRETAIFSKLFSSRHSVKNDEGNNKCQKGHVKMWTGQDIFSRISYLRETHHMRAKCQKSWKFPLLGK